MSLKNGEVINLTYNYFGDLNFFDYTMHVIINCKTLDNETLMEFKKWSINTYKDKIFYKEVSMGIIFNDEIKKEIIFPQAYLVTYKQTFDYKLNKSLIFLTLKQKKDEIRNVKIKPELKSSTKKNETSSKFMLMKYPLKPKDQEICTLSPIETCNKHIKKILIYQSKKLPGFDDKSNIAPDMKYGDYSIKMLKELNEKGCLTKGQITLCEELNADLLFASFGNLIEATSKGEMRKVAENMVNHFRNNNGDDYENEVLTENAKNHKNTRSYVKQVINLVTKYIREEEKSSGYISNILNIKNDLGGPPDSKDENNSENKDITPKKYGAGFQAFNRPTFNGLFTDTFEGLRITVNDTWGMRIYLKDYVYCKKSKLFKGVLEFEMYDHFGLDLADVKRFGKGDNIIQNLDIRRKEGFGAWFCLQRYKGFRGEFRPFVDYMRFEENIKNFEDI